MVIYPGYLPWLSTLVVTYPGGDLPWLSTLVVIYPGDVLRL